MKTIVTEESLPVPNGVTIAVESRVVTVTGPRGKLTRAFKHLNFEMMVVGKKNKKFLARVYFATKKQIASLRTLLSHIKNMITGVTKGFEYKMRLVYAHFPIGANTTNSGVEIRNFLGEKIVRRVPMLEGVKIIRSEKTKDELVLTGNDIEKVSQSGKILKYVQPSPAANIHHATLVKGGKDIRKFLDGVYVSEKKIIGQD